MSEEGPKLFTNKPKKAQLLKHLKQELKEASTNNSASATLTSSAAASYKMGPPPPPPPPPPKEPFLRRYKFLIPMILAVNFAFGAYLFLRTKNKDTGKEEEVPSNVPSTPVSTSAPTETSTPLPSVSVPAPAKPREPIPENEQRQLFKWMLEEKRKIKPKDAEEKKRLDEEKAILKQFIRAKSIPNI